MPDPTPLVDAFGGPSPEPSGEGARPSRAGSPRWLRAVTIVAWAALVAFTVASLGGALVGRSTFLATDLMSARFQPWSTYEGTAAPPNDHPFGAQNPWLGDTVDVITPTANLVGRGAHDGHLVEWSPFSSGGVEVGGLPNDGMWSPLSLPWWLFPGPFAPAAVKLLEILAVTVGMSLFLRRLRLPQATWPVASVAFLSSGFMVAWTNWPQTRVAAFIPLFFWALDRAVTHRSWWNVPIVGAALGAMIAGGFPAVVAYALYYAVPYVIVRALTGVDTWPQRLLACVRAAAGVVASVLITAFVVLPFAYNAATVLDFEVRQQGPQSFLGWLPLATAISPNALGTADFTGGWGPSNPIERFSYMGLASLVLIAAAVLWTRRGRVVTAPAVFFGVSSILTVWMIYFGGFVLALVQRLPFMDTNPIGRNRAMLGFFVAVLVAYGFGALVARMEPAVDVVVTPAPRRHAVATVTRWVLALALGAGTAVLAVATALQVSFGRQLLTDFFVVPALIGVVAVAAAAVVHWDRSRARQALGAVVIIGLVVVPATAVTREWWPRNPVESFYPSTPTTDFLQEHVGTDRFATVGGAMMPGSSVVYGLRSLGGRAFVTPEWRDLVQAVDDKSFQSATYITLSAANLESSLHNGILDRLGVRYVVAATGDPVLGRQEHGAQAEGVTTKLTDGGTARTASTTGPVRAVSFPLEAPLVAGPDGASATLTLRRPDGSSIAEVTTWFRQNSGALSFAIPAEDIPSGQQWFAEVSLRGAGSSVTLRGDGAGNAAADLTRPADDGLRLVHGGDAVIWERTTALPRVRWASSETVITDPAARVKAMADPATPDQTVILEEPGDERDLDGTSEATVADREGTTNTITADVRSTGPGWVVVADSLRRAGWSATVDGHPAHLVDAEHTGGAVFVPSAGEHVVELRFETPWFAGGVITTIVTLALLLLLGAAHVGVRVVRSRRQVATAAPVRDAALTAD